MNAGSNREPGGAARLFALLNHAAQRAAAGDLAQAILTLQAAIRVAPAHAPAHHDLGFLCLQSGRLSEATAALRTALQLDPTFAQASLCLGIALQDQGDSAGAEAAYRGARMLNPSLIVAHVCLGALLESRGDMVQAIDVFRGGAARGPGTLWGRLASARALVADNRDLEAEPALRELIADHPANGMAQEMLATLLADSGRFEEAREGYERAIAAAPALAGCYYDLSRCRRLVAADRPLLSRMQTTLQSPSLTADARLKVHLALGKAFDDLGDPETAMRHFDDAEAARRSLMHFDAHAFEQRVDRLIAHFTPDRVARTPEGAPQDGRSGGETAVLILGLPRSGTTLVEHIISSHPLVHPAGELSFWTRRGAEWEASGFEHAQNPHAQPAAFTTLSADYRKLLQRLAPHAARVTDKSPLNVLWAGLIHVALPRATMIYCQRPAVDTAWSIHRTYFNPQLAFPTGGLDLVRAIRAVERLAAHWRSVLPPDRFVEIGYGQLVADPDRTIRRLIAGCHLPWDPACLEPERNRRIIKTPSKWQARQPIHREFEESWRRYAPWLGPLSVLIEPSRVS